jgi:hypothetical protein
MALLLTIAACGGQAVSLPPSTPATTAANTGTAGADAAAAGEIKAMSDYTTALKQWAENFAADFGDEGNKALTFKDPYHPTDSELLRARQFTESVRKSVAQLKTISPPPKVAEAHAEFYSSLRGELDAMDRFINALGWGSERDVELAFRDAEKANAQWAHAVKALAPYVDLTGVIRS